jgi:putative sterol carrier protein
VPEDLWAVLDLWHGECRDARMVESTEGERAPFVIRAPYSRWKEVLRGDLDPVKGMMQGKLRLQGDLATIVRHVRAANELVHLTMEVPTQFLDELPAASR